MGAPNRPLPECLPIRDQRIADLLICLFSCKLAQCSNVNFASGNDDVTKFVDSYTIPTAKVNEMLAYYVDESGGDMEATAMHFLSTNNVWESWVSADVAAKIKSAL